MRIHDLPYPDPGVPDARSGPRLLWWLWRNQLGGQLKALAWGLLHFVAVSALPFCVGFAVQAVVDRSGTRLALTGALMLLCGTAIAVGDTFLHRAAVTNWITAAARVQQLLARKAAELGSALTRRVAAGEVVAVSTGDVEKIGWFVEAVSRFTAAAVTVVVVCVGLLVYQPALGTVVAAGLPVVALAVLPLLPRATRRADVQREKAGRATELASDTVAGLRVLRGIGGEELFLDRYRHASQEVRHAAVRSARMWSLISAVQVLLPGLLLIAVVWYGVHLVREGRIAVGELVTVYSSVMVLSYPLQHFEEIAMSYSFSRPSAKRAARVLSLERSAADGDARESAGGDRAEVPTGDLYDPATGLTAPTGRLTVVVCGDPDAAGRLAERLGGHPTEPGRSVLLGGTPLDELPLDLARTAVLVQDKDPVLLSGTLRELLDVPASGAVTAADALAAARCEDVLDALVQGSLDTADPMDARITERGRSLSGGQRQRLALARSLVTDPEVLVLDEPTSAVDSHTEARIADGLRRLRSGRTTVVFTSSPLLLDRADGVVLVHGDEVVATGTHRELFEGEPRYRAVVTRETDDEPATADEDILLDTLGKLAEIEESA
ncbi:ATP-binding cassette domain-containing protein [Streptomyces sp. SID8366]|uniref:ABC transporter transmembrane domain-containing protein n=1 Tax=unclassified Streptomyces TaxID=2593676 RepID=UPI000DBA91EB|nr:MULTISPECIES: ABC transporter ATP-binding protein [unclassified Streptomyces]MYU08225.1 ATP-binding cassette domain-containing protein [Streptomyces sp. SID8366]MYU63651.1 ATP-binding cassette domain-containing protein [Streptomyces sp. SID69]RAJ59425.1 ABC-type multidrug transport system fused ATPase/permease subunit [Streptomyces sp. PsTaAH-130]